MTAQSERYISHRTLLKCDRAVKTRGRDLIYQYAGVNPEKRFVTFGTRRATRETAMLLLNDLRTATTNAEYNQLLDSFHATVRESQAEQPERKPVRVHCPACGLPLQISPEIADRASAVCPRCNPVGEEGEL